MKNAINTKFNVSDKTEFLKTVNPSHPTLEKKIGKACADSADQLLNKIQKKRHNNKYKSYFSTSHDNIYRYIELSKTERVDFTVKVLNTFLCFFFFKKPSKYRYTETHTEENLRNFFGHIKISNGRYEDIEVFNNFMRDLELVKEYLTPLFNDFSFEINEEWEFSMIKNDLSEKDEGTNIQHKFSKSISGTDIIDNNFYKKIKEDFFYSKPQFYTAKLDPKCQWYGIINNYDAPRKEYRRVKNVALTVFSHVSLKVSAIVYGFGGSGKSTLLRRLAIDLRNKNFVTLWIKERQFVDFYTQGLNTIKATPNVNFLIIIEDWYRLTNEHILEAKIFLKDTKGIQNIRLIIGDRTVKEEVNKQLNNPENIFHLNNQENKTIIKSILEKNSEWIETANEIFKDEKNYNSTLFLLLFVLARFHEDKLERRILNLTEPNSAFRNIITEDFKTLSNAYPGFAKALFYWANIYRQNKFYISYDCFLELADDLNKENPVSKILFNLTDGKSKIHSLLRQYINIDVSKNKAQESVSFLQFNHDVLADLGISKLKILNLGDYDDIAKKRLLDKSILIQNNNTSVAALVHHFTKNEPQIFRNKQEALEYVLNIVKTGNNEVSFLNTYPTKTINEDFITLFVKELIVNNTFPQLFLTQQIKQFPKVSILLLNSWIDCKIIPMDILPLAIKRCNDTSVKQKASNMILDDFNLKLKKTAPLVVALKMARDETKIKKICEKVLNAKNVLEFDFSLIAVAIRVCPNKELQFNKAIFFIENSKKVNWEILFQSIKALELKKELPNTVHPFVDQIVKDFKNGINKYRFLNISQVELHTITSWKKMCEKIINNWKEYEPTYISYILYSHRFHPLSTKEVSEEILQNWETEIEKSIQLVYGKRITGYHVFNALKNPLLDKDFILKVAKEIKIKNDVYKLNTYKLLLEAIDNIVNNNVFATWIPRN